MDFPLNLSSKLDFVYGRDEFQQDVRLVLTEQLGNFLFSPKFGAEFSIHSSDRSLLTTAIENSLKKIPGLTVQSVVVIEDVATCRVVYKNKIEEFQFNLNM